MWIVLVVTLAAIIVTATVTVKIMQHDDHSRFQQMTGGGDSPPLGSSWGKGTSIQTPIKDGNENEKNMYSKDGWEKALSKMKKGPEKK